VSTFQERYAASVMNTFGPPRLVLVKPHQIFADPELASAIAQIVPQTGFAAFAEASGVGIVIDADALPIDPAARAQFEACGEDAVASALRGGDDYELLFTVRPRTRRRLRRVAQHGGVAITRIGECTADRAVVMRRGGELSPLPRGFSHFA